MFIASCSPDLPSLLGLGRRVQGVLSTTLLNLAWVSGMESTPCYNTAHPAKDTRTLPFHLSA